jgi:hypothetical protein
VATTATSGNEVEITAKIEAEESGNRVETQTQTEVEISGNNGAE